MNPSRILVVEDDAILRDRLSAMLSREGYDVVKADCGVAALTAVAREPVDAIVLDLGLPDLDGCEVLAGARAVSSAPILVLSGRAGSADKVAALDLGADDYVVKPFDTDELLARIRVALRGRPAPSGAEPALVLDLQARRALVEGKAVRLSALQARFLEVLAQRGGATVSHHALAEAIWSDERPLDLGALRVLAWQVRHKIEPDAAAPRFLIAEAGEGYRLNQSGVSPA